MSNTAADLVSVPPTLITANTDVPSLKLLQKQEKAHFLIFFPRSKTRITQNDAFVLPLSSLPRSLTCDIDGPDEGLWDFVPNVHQAGRVDDDVDPPGGLQHAAIVGDVTLDDHHLCPL